MSAASVAVSIDPTSSEAHAAVGQLVQASQLLLLLVGLQGISGDIYEAARIDGASDPRILFSIVLPLTSSAQES